MKTIALFIPALVGFAMLSCVKAHECNCTEIVTNNDPNVTPVVTQSTLSTQDMSAKEARTYCNAQDSNVYDGKNTTNKTCNYKD
jgi:hypothetical protein